MNSWINSFLRNIVPKWNPKKVLLFGSRAVGSPLLFSDVDLLVVSEKFRSLNFRERKSALIQEWEGLVDLEVICLTPEEFLIKKTQIGIIQEIVKTGTDLLR